LAGGTIPWRKGGEPEKARQKGKLSYIKVRFLG